MSVRSRCLASLLVLLATACAAPEPLEEPAVAREESAALAVAPIGDAAARSAPTPELAALSEAYHAARWEEVLDRSDACLQTRVSDECSWWAGAMAASAAYGLQRWEECVRFCRVSLEAERRLPPDEGRARWMNSLGGMESSSLLALGRSREASERLDRMKTELPGIEDDAGWRGLRLAARIDDGIETDVGRGERYSASRLDAGRRRLEAALPRAIERVRRRLGVPELQVPPIGICAVDPDHWDSDFLMYATAVRRGSGWVGVIYSKAEAVAHPTMEDEAFLAHELTHVLHLSGTDNVQQPAWLREGVAHWVEATEDENRLVDLALSVEAKGLDPAVSRMATLLESEDTLSAAEEQFQRAGGAVIFFELERMLGTAAVQRIVACLVREPDYALVLRRETGLEMLRLLERVREGYSEWRKKSLGFDRGFHVIVRSQEDGDLGETLRRLDEFLAREEAGTLRSVAEMLRVYLLLDSDDIAGAFAALEPIRASRRARPFGALVGSFVNAEIDCFGHAADWAGLASFAREALDSPWVALAKTRREVEEALAEAEKRLAEVAPPK